MPDNLQLGSFAWALAHVRRFGDTDIFPVPFEYEAIAHDWNAIGPFLGEVDLASHKQRPTKGVMVVKPGGGYRAATQLDPLDHLIYTAAVYEASESIERARVPEHQRIACSCRIHVTPEGAFFSADNGWTNYHTRSKELAGEAEITHVLTADISDFYN